jgi:serine/threonine-protein kinase
VYETNDGLWLAPLEGDSAVRRLGSLPGMRRGNMSLSPDVHWLAYVTSTSGRPEVYVRTFPEEGKIWQITHGGGVGPFWSPRGGEIIYVRESGSGGSLWMCSGRVSTTKDRITVASLAQLFEIPPDVAVIGIHPDGERFLGLRPVAAEFKGDRVEAVLHWSDQVATRAPGRPSHGS